MIKIPGCGPLLILSNYLQMRNIYILLIISLFLKPLESFAWGREGHHMVAEIAKSQLSQNVRDSVQKYLGTMSFEDASTWMDDVRSDHSFDYMRTWHYIDIEKGKSYNPDLGEHNCVTELQRVIKELDSKSKLSKDQINFDIKVLFHLVGDLGQPLHTGYPDDKGGNTIQVNFMGKQVNLHHVWDTDIIEYKNITTQSCLNAGLKLTNSELSTIKKIDVLSWMYDSRSYLPEVYSFQNNILDETYIDKNVPIIEKQIFESGTRLASVLTQVFAK